MFLRGEGNVSQGMFRWASEKAVGFNQPVCLMFHIPDLVGVRITNVEWRQPTGYSYSRIQTIETTVKGM